MSHVTFSRHPSHHRGALYTDTLEPLVLHGCVLDVELHEFTARVQCTYEYKHLTSRPATIFVAVPQLPHWRLASLKTESNGKKVDSHVGHGGTPSQGEQPQGYHMQTIPNSEAFVATVVTQAIPWTIAIQDLVLITAVYVVPLNSAIDADTLTLRLPKELFPWQITPSQTAMEYAMQFPSRNMPRLSRGFSVNLRGKLFENAAAVPTITCGNLRSNGSVHQTNKNSVSARLEFDHSTTKVQQDVVVQVSMLVSQTEPLQLHMVKEFMVEKGGSNAAAPNPHMYAGVASVVPLFNSEQLASGPNVELVFLVDGSSSMLQHWAAVQQALRIAVHQLPPTTYINLVRYTSDLDWAYPQGAELLTESVRGYLLDQWMPKVLAGPATDGNVSKLYRAIQAIYAQPYITGFARSVILLTDSGAEVNLAHRAVEVIRANTHSTRFSALALGPNADVGFLQLATREGLGAFAHALTVESKEEDDSASSKQLSTSASSHLAAILKQVHVPTLVHVTASVRYDDLRSDEAPPVQLCTLRPVMPCVPQSTRSVFHLFAHASIAPSFTLSVHGLLGLHQLSYKVQSPDLRNLQQASAREAGKTETVSLAHAGAALARVDRLVSGSGQHSAPTAEDVKEIEQISLSFVVPSPYIPYESTVTSQSGQPVTVIDEAPLSSTVSLTARYVPQSLTLRHELETSNRGVLLRDTTGIAKADPDQSARFASNEAATHRMDGAIDAFLKQTIIDEAVRLATSSGNVVDVILSQDLEGGFSNSAKLYSGIGITAKFAEERLPAAGTEPEQWATALAIAYLEAQGPRPLVTLSVEKGRAYLKKEAVAGADTLLTAAARVIAH